MLSRRTERGSTSAALAFGVFLVFMTVVTVYIFWAKVWWFPPAINDIGREIDAQFMRTLLITGIVFVAAQLGLAYAIFKFRDQGQKAASFEGNNTMEIIWTLATVVLFVGLGLYARNAWAEVHFTDAAPGALQIEVTGQQFVWNFRYAGPDGKFGREKPELVSASTGNPVGLDPTDPASKDDVVSPVIAVPAGPSRRAHIRRPPPPRNPRTPRHARRPPAQRRLPDQPRQRPALAGLRACLRQCLGE